MASEAQRKATARYDANNTVRISLKLNLNTDIDILDKLENVANKTGYIKELIRDDIQKNAGKKENSKKV
jgi:hypothetical protein